MLGDSHDFDHRRIYRPLRQRAKGWQPDPGMTAIAEVEADFPHFDVDQVTAEVNRRGTSVTREFVDAVMAAGRTQ